MALKLTVKHLYDGVVYIQRYANGTNSGHLSIRGLNTKQMKDIMEAHFGQVHLTESNYKVQAVILDLVCFTNREANKYDASFVFAATEDGLAAAAKAFTELMPKLETMHVTDYHGFSGFRAFVRQISHEHNLAELTY